MHNVEKQKGKNENQQKANEYKYFKRKLKQILDNSLFSQINCRQDDLLRERQGRCKEEIKAWKSEIEGKAANLTNREMKE